MVTDQFVFKVVGITNHNVRIDDELHTLYFTDDGLNELSRSSIYSKSETYVEAFGTSTYNTPTETWITKEMDDTVYLDTIEFSLYSKILIDNSLNDFEIRTFDMMFFDTCRDFG